MEGTVTVILLHGHVILLQICACDLTARSCDLTADHVILLHNHMILLHGHVILCRSCDLTARSCDLTAQSCDLTAWSCDPSVWVMWSLLHSHVIPSLWSIMVRSCNWLVNLLWESLLIAYLCLTYMHNVATSISDTLTVHEPCPWQHPAKQHCDAI